jgi:hypothetical protein
LAALLPQGAAFLNAGLAMKIVSFGDMEGSNNLSELTNTATARSNLGLGSAALLDTSAVAQTANNLSDLASAATARTNLGLGSAALLASSAVAQTANNLSDLANASTARTNLGLGTAAVADTGTTDGTLKTLNADGGFSLAHTATTITPSSVFGSDWKTANLIRATTSDTTANGGYAAFSVYRNTVAGNASRNDYGLHVECVIDNYLTTTAQGSTTAAMFNIRGGSAGDIGGLQINSHIVTSTTNGSTGVEAQMAELQATTGTKLQEFKAVLGGILPGTDLRADGFGFMVRPNITGSTTEHGVLVLGLSSAANTGIVTAIECSATLAAADTYFVVTGDQHADGAGRVRGAAGSETKPTFSFVGDEGTGFYQNGATTIAVSSDGTRIANFGPDGFRVGQGLTDQGAGTLNVLTSLHVNNNKVLGARKTGWAVDTGTAKRTANATYSGTAGATYDQTVMQTLMDAVRDATQTIKALKDDFHSTAGHGFIGT